MNKLFLLLSYYSFFVFCSDQLLSERQGEMQSQLRVIERNCKHYYKPLIGAIYNLSDAMYLHVIDRSYPKKDIIRKSVYNEEQLSRIINLTKTITLQSGGLSFILYAMYGLSELRALPYSGLKYASIFFLADASVRSLAFSLFAVADVQ
jgi:hypothetical protein